MFDALLRGLFWFALLFVSYNAFAPPEHVTAPALSDVVLHVGAFIGLTGLLLAAYPLVPQWLSATALLVYGAGVELVQSQLPLRHAEWKDLAVDGAGIILGFLIYRIVGQRWVQQARARWQTPSD